MFADKMCRVLLLLLSGIMKKDPSKYTQSLSYLDRQSHLTQNVEYEHHNLNEKVRHYLYKNAPVKCT